MTHRTGRQGRNYSRAGLGPGWAGNAGVSQISHPSRRYSGVDSDRDPRGTWGTGAPASAGFMPERHVYLETHPGSGYAFAGPRPASSGVDPSRIGYTFSGSGDDIDVSRVSTRRFRGD